MVEEEESENGSKRPFNRIVHELFSKRGGKTFASFRFRARVANGYCRAARHRSNGTNSATRSFRQEEIKVPLERASAPCPISPHLAAILARSNVPPTPLIVHWFIEEGKKRKKKRGKKRKERKKDLCSFDNCSFVRNSLKIEELSSTLHDVKKLLFEATIRYGGGAGRGGEGRGEKKKKEKRVEKLEAVGK